MKYLPVFMIILTILLSACHSTPAAMAPLPTPTVLATIIPLSSPASPTFTQTITPTVQPTVVPILTTPLVADLQATVIAGLPPIPDISGFQSEGIQVHIFPLKATSPSQSLWAVWTEGIVEITARKHFVAIYTYGDTGWEELDRLELEGPFQVDLVEQAHLVAERIWLAVQGKAGMHPDSYDLLSFDGHLLRNETYRFIQGMGHGRIIDVNGDHKLDLVLDQNLGYGFLCGMCLIYELEFQTLRWDGSTFNEARLTPLPPSSQSARHDVNNRAVALARAGLWKGAQELINQARRLEPEEPTVAWNAGIINLYAEARAAHVGESLYPLLTNLFYGDYSAALALIRPYKPEEIFSAQTPLVIDLLPQETWATLADKVKTLTTQALKVEPKLAEAYFLRGWAISLVEPDNPQVLTDVQQAAVLNPDESLFAESLVYLQKQARGEHQAKEIESALITPTLTIVPTPTREALPDEVLKFRGTASKDQVFEQKLSDTLTFRLEPHPNGWNIWLGNPLQPDRDFAAVATPPFHGMNARFIRGWHFRNSDNTGPNEWGEKNVNAPQKERYFQFVLNETDYKQALTSLNLVQPRAGRLIITQLELGNLVPGEQAWIEVMEFEVELSLPPEFNP